MNRLPLILAIILLLLAPVVSARGGELDAQKQAMQDAAAKLELLLVELDETDDPQERAELEERIAAARAAWEARKADLAKAHAAHVALRKRYAAIGEHVKALMARLTAIHTEAAAQAKAIEERGDPKAKEAFEPYLQRVTRNLGEVHAAADALAHFAVAIERGDLAAARERLVEAEERVAHVRMLVAAAEAEKQRLDDVLDWRRTVEHARRLQEGAAAKAAEIAAKRAELERLRARAARLREDAARLEAERAGVEKARDRLEEDDGTVVRARLAVSDLANARRRLETMERNLETMRAKGIDEDHPGLKSALEKIEELKRELATAEAQGKGTPSVIRLETDEDGRLVVRGLEVGPETLEGRILGDGQILVEGDLVVQGEASKADDLDYRPVEVVPHDQKPLRVIYSDGKVTWYGPEGQVIRKLAEAQRPVVVTKSVQGTYRSVGGPPDPKLEKQIESLKKAAKLLREAGQVEEAKRLEKKQKELEARRPRYTVVSTPGMGNAQVLKAIDDLRGEVRALRAEVRELKALILKGR